MSEKNIKYPSKPTIFNPGDHSQINGQIISNYLENKEGNKGDEHELGNEIRTGVSCLVCHKEIVETFSVQYSDSMHRPVIIGPGSRDQFSRMSEGLHCSGCGIMYRYLPKPK